MSKPLVHFRSPAAFSLVELVLVVSIMAVLAGLAVPRFGRASARYRADAAAKRVASDLLQAQQRARAGSGPCSVTFNTSAGTTSTLLPTIGGVTGRTVTTNLTLPPYQSTIRSAAFGNALAVTFDGFGVPSSAGAVVVASGSEQRTITLTAGSGAIATTSP